MLYDNIGDKNTEMDMHFCAYNLRSNGIDLVV